MTAMISFLRDLDAHNDKAWMDAHRARYEAQRDWFLDWLAELNDRLKAAEGYVDTTPKDAIERINNNLLYHPEKPTYKAHFGATMDQSKGHPGLYLKLGLHDSMIAGGYHHPDSDELRAIRRAIDRDGDALVAILGDDAFAKAFGGLSEGDELKTAPQGYDADHPHIELLRLKSFAVRRPVTQAEYSAEGFQDEVVETYRAMRPLRNWLGAAVG